MDRTYEDKIAANKKLVTTFYEEVFVKHNLEVIDEYIAEDYIQHNPGVATGREGFKAFITKMGELFPNSQSKMHRVIAEGDLVVLHVFLAVDEKDAGSAIIDIFRVEGNQIVEHWDVMQPIPEQSANTNTMF